MMHEIERRVWVREALYALLVVALTFLNFGHTSAVFAAGGRVVITSHSTCGDQQAPSDGEHFACHACRPGAIALPPTPADAVAVVFTATPVVYADLCVALAELAPPLAAQPRGPPAAD
jgi:hypothetical protein